jgi:hypothetical protein
MSKAIERLETEMSREIGRLDAEMIEVRQHVGLPWRGGDRLVADDEASADRAQTGR